MREHHALRVAGRTRRVDQYRHRSEIAGRRVRARVDTGRCALRRTSCFERAHRIGPVAFETYDRPCVRHAVVNAAREQTRACEDELGFTVVDDICDLIECLRRKDRNDNEARRQRRPIGDEPIDAVLGDDRNAVAGSQAGSFAQCDGEIVDAALQLRARDAMPNAIDALAEHVLARIRKMLTNELRQRWHAAIVRRRIGRGLLAESPRYRRDRSGRRVFQTDRRALDTRRSATPTNLPRPEYARSSLHRRG